MSTCIDTTQKGQAMAIWLELGIFGLVFVFAFWQMHDVRKAQEQTRQMRAREKAEQEARDLMAESEKPPHQPNEKP
jgi:uncharacterized protein HemX